MRLASAVLLLAVALSLSGCTSPTMQAPPPGGETTAAVTAPQKSQKPSSRPAAPDRSCRSDSDCAVKDVGNCCGYFPMCVNKNAQTDPAAVRAACEREGIASICGFEEVKGCRCVDNRCENLRDGLPEAM